MNRSPVPTLLVIEPGGRSLSISSSRELAEWQVRAPIGARIRRAGELLAERTEAGWLFYVL